MKIQHDFHLHTTVSFCADKSATVKNYFERFRTMDIKKIAFTDHFWDCTKAEPENEWIAQYDYPYLARIKEEIKAEGEVPFQVYFGCEAEYNPQCGGLIITEETAEKFDFVVAASSHTHHFLTESELASPEKTAEGMYAAYEDIITCGVSRFIGSMAHPFSALGNTPYEKSILYGMISDDRYLRLFEKTAEKGIAYEINMAEFRKKENGEAIETYDAEEIAALPPARLVRLAKKAGCQFVFGSDAHSIEGHEKWFPRADILAEVFEIKEHDLAEIVK